MINTYLMNSVCNILHYVTNFMLSLYLPQKGSDRSIGRTTFPSIEFSGIEVLLLERVKTEEAIVLLVTQTVNRRRTTSFPLIST